MEFAVAGPRLREALEASLRVIDDVMERQRGHRMPPSLIRRLTGLRAAVLQYNASHEHPIALPDWLVDE